MEHGTPAEEEEAAEAAEAMMVEVVGLRFLVESDMSRAMDIA